MKSILFVTSTYFALATCTFAAPVVAPLSAEASLTDSIRSFESAWSQLDDKIAVAAKKKEAFGRREKWLTGTAAALTTAGTAGYIISPAISMGVAHRKDSAMRELNQAVWEAQRARSATTPLDQTQPKAKRSEVEAMKATAEDAESFVSALSRTNSDRLSDLDHADLLHGHPSTKQPDRSAPPAYTIQPQGSASPSNFFRPESPSRDSVETQDRLAALERALLDIKQHQHDQQKLNTFTKVLIGTGVANAVGGVVSAELSAENAVEAAKRKGAKVPDVSELDRDTCERFKKELTDLDCSKAQGISGTQP